MEIILVNIRVSMANSREMGSFWAMMEATDCCSNRESPKSPRHRSPSQTKYCWTAGLSSPNWARISSSSTVMPIPEYRDWITSTAEPGIRRISANVMMLTTKIEGINSRTRFKIYFPI